MLTEQNEGEQQTCGRGCVPRVVVLFDVVPSSDFIVFKLVCLCVCSQTERTLIPVGMFLMSRLLIWTWIKAV